MNIRDQTLNFLGLLGILLNMRVNQNSLKSYFYDVQLDFKEQNVY